MPCVSQGSTPSARRPPPLGKGSASGAMLNICLVGFGAIGALYGFAIEQSGKAHLTIVCRSNYSTIQEHGILIESDRLGTHPWQPSRIVSSVEAAADRPYDFIVCAFKCVSDVNTTSALIGPLLKTLSPSSNTSIVLLQNGVGIEEELYASLGQLGLGTPILSGCAWVDATAVDDGRRVVQHGYESLILGLHRRAGVNLPLGETALEAFCELLRVGGVSIESAPAIDIARWRKVLWNASFSTMCTLTRATVGELLAIPEARENLEEIMLEVLSVSRRVLPGEATDLLPDSVARSIVENENAESVFKPSMLVDLESGRPMEVEAIVGGIIRGARRHGLIVPRLDMIYASLKVIQRSLIK
ncbi:hypothetical protein PHLGIDRAFT_102441, partial [Phlebiopsis gigantea 11061_1 CR5-6]